MKRSGFTLIELLVVIAIIAILAGIALPVFTKSQERARSVQDANNLRQLGIAMVAYHADHDDVFPTGTPPWAQALNPRYISSWKAFQSPFDKRTPSEAPASAPVSYSMNVNLVGKPSGDVASPSACILMAPLMSAPANLEFTGTSSTAASLDRSSNGTGNSGGTHANGMQINAVFADTHVSSMKMSDFHASQPNPETGAAISDVRWNK
jgi:prepilin-type N-terminal cleavage/methylation domain-containing protein